MSDSYEKRDTLPFTWMGRVPVYATTVMVVLNIVGMFTTVILRSAHVPIGYYIGFAPSLCWKEWHLWSLVSYVFLSQPSFFYILGLLCLYSFGIGVESYLGRRVYLRIVAALILSVPLVSTAIWLINGSEYPLPSRNSGDFDLFVGIFVAYATLYPNVEYWNWITMKWMAFAGIFLSCLMYLPNREWWDLTTLLVSCGVAHGLVRYERGHWNLPKFRFPSRKPKLRILPKPTSPPRRIPREEMEVEDSVDTEVDALLDKIAKSGITSLTPAERARLEKARQELLKRERQ